VELAKNNASMSTPEQPNSQPQHSRDILVNRVETYTREEPTKALSAAFGVGILLLVAIIGTVVALCTLPTGQDTLLYARTKAD
jgi:hypothetical protein